MRVLELIAAAGCLVAVTPAFAEPEAPPTGSLPADEVPAETPVAAGEAAPAYDLKTTTDGALIRWIEEGFTLHLAPTTAVSMARFRRDMIGAIRTWDDTDVVPRMELAVDETNVRVVDKDGVNTVFFVENDWEFDPRIVALTFTHIRVRDGAVMEMDMAINSDRFSFDPASDDPLYDLESVIAHELGHALGLPDFPRAPEATMFGEVDPFSTKARDLDDVDLEAIHELYAAPGEQGETPSGCPAAPPASFSILLLALGFRRRLKRAHALLGATALLLFATPLLAPNVSAGTREGVRALVVSREAPRVAASNPGVFPATDLVIRAEDGTLYRVRVPGKTTGAVQARVLHAPIPKRGGSISVPPHAVVLDESRRR